MMTAQLAVGIGCSTTATCDDVLELIRSSAVKIAPDTLLGTLDRRSTIARKVADMLGLRLMIFSAVQLAEVTAIEHRSSVALQHVGTHSVAEASALACLGMEARLITPRIIGRFCTCAVAGRP